MPNSADSLIASVPFSVKLLADLGMKGKSGLLSFAFKNLLRFLLLFSIRLLHLMFLIAKSNKDGYNEKYHDTIELFGLYWHYVDVVWVFVFPFFYLY